MDRWKSRGGKSQREKRRRRKKIRGKRTRRKKMQVCEKAKSGITVFLQWFVDLQGWQLGLLKRRVQSHLAGGEMIKGPDNSTSQLLPVIRNSGWSGTEKAERTKEMVKDKIKGPDNPTSQLLPKMNFNGFSGDREGRKDKGGGERSRR